MVNSGSFDSDGDRNGKARCTQASDAATGSQSSDSGDAADATCKTDCSKSADSDLPSDASAIEPTPNKTEINSSMPTEASPKNISPASDIKTSLCCSLPLEKIQNALTSSPPENSIAEDKVKRTRKLLCLYCDRSFVSANLRQKHVERVHIAKPTRRVSARRQNQLSLTTCVHCDKLNASEHTLNDLFQHLVQEHPAKYFGCLSCEERFLTSTYLVDHNTSKHGAEEKANIKRHPPNSLQIEEIDVDTLQDGDDVPLKVTRSKLRNKTEDPLNVEANPDLQRRKKKSKLKELRSKKISVKTSKIALKRSKRLQAQAKEDDSLKKRRDRKLATANKSEASNSTKQPEKSKTICVNPYPEFDNFYRVKKITDHSIDNLKISSLTFDDVFDKAFFNRIKCNIEENLLHHIDGKLFKNEESESRISNFEKISTTPQEIQNSTSENYGCELSLNAITPVPSLSLNSQFGEDFESQIEYASKPSKKKTQTKSDEVHYKYFTRRKYQASILQQKENRDLSKLDMWTQMLVKERQEKIVNKKKNAKEIQEYTSGQEYKNKMKREELNRILDRRGPFEDLKEEASKKAAFDKLNLSLESDISQEVFTDVREVLNEILNKVFEAVKEDDCQPEIPSKEIDYREIPAYLDLRRKNSSTQEEIDKSDRIALICSSQETENYELPTNTVREKNELVELTGEWARSRMYICAACGGKFSNIKYLLEHRSIYHQNVWVQNYEFVGNQSELYRHLSIPGLGKVGVVEETIPCKQWKRSDSRTCTKCGKQCNSLGELHRHVLECGGDWTWMLARKKCKYRPFGAKSRRKRRGLMPRIHNKRKTEPSEKKNHKKPIEGPRQRPSDADTIQRMLANLPAKRSRRSLISLRDVVFKSRKNKQGNNTQKAKVKCGKTVCKKQKPDSSKSIINQQRNSRCLRSLNKVLSSRILDLNSSLIVKRKLKAIRGRRSTKSSLQTKSTMNETASEETENETSSINSGTLAPQKRKSPKKGNSEGADTVARNSLCDKNKPVTKRMLSSRLNIKSFFTIKKKNVRSSQKTSISDQPETTDNNENETTIEPKKKSVYFENSQTLKKNKRGGLKGFVRALSLRKRNSKYEETSVSTDNKNPCTTVTVESNTSAVTPRKVGRPKTKNVTPVNQFDKASLKNLSSTEHINLDEGLSKKRKLQRGFRNVINKVKKIKTDKTVHKSAEKAPVKDSSIEIETQPFLEEKTLHKAIIPPEKVANSGEVKENIRGKEDHVPIVADVPGSKENPPIAESIINVANNEEKCLQVTEELNFDNKQNVPSNTGILHEPIPANSDDLGSAKNDSSCLDFANNITPLSPNIKRKIKKPNRGLNDCIAMLTSKLQQRDDKISSSLESLFSTSSTTSIERAESRALLESISPPVRQQKTECILKIPTFRATKSPVVEEETALDLSKKSFSSPNLFFPQSSDINMGYIESTINRVIEGVIEHKCKEVLTEKFAAPAWTSVDDIIQQVVQNGSSTIFSRSSNKKNTFTTRTHVDDTIDYVVNSSGDWFESKTNPTDEKRKLCRKSRRRKNSDDNLIKDIIFGKDKLIIAPSSSLHNALENSLIAKIKENESKMSNNIATTSNSIHDRINKDLRNTAIDGSISDHQADHATASGIPKDKVADKEPDKPSQILVIDKPNFSDKISHPTLVEDTTVSKKLNSVESEIIKDKRQKDSINKSNAQFKEDEGIKEKASTLENEKLIKANKSDDKSKSINVNGSLIVKNIENELFPNNDISEVIKTPKARGKELFPNNDISEVIKTPKTKARGKGRVKKTQKQDQQKNSVIETNIDDCLNVKVINNVEINTSSMNFPSESSNLGDSSTKNKHIELITENEPIILENKVFEQTVKSLLSDSEDEVPLAVIANKQDENELLKHVYENSNLLWTSKIVQEPSNLEELQDGKDKTEELNVDTSTSNLLDKPILDNEKNSSSPLNVTKDIVENSTTDSLKENIAHTVNENENFKKCVSKRKTNPLKVRKLIKRKRRKIVFGAKRPTSNQRKFKSSSNILVEPTESGNDSADLKIEQEIHVNPILPNTTSVALDTTKSNNLEASKSELPKEDQSDLPREEAVCNEIVCPSNVSSESNSVKCQHKNTEINEPIKILINTQRTRRKSKSSKKIDKFDNDLFKDFSLVINKKTKRIPPTSIVDDSVCDDVLDTSINMLLKPVEIGKVDNMNILQETHEPPLNDSVEEMDMELEDIPINTNIIERDDQQIVAMKSYGEKTKILTTEVNIHRPCTPDNEVESTRPRKSPRKKGIPDLAKTLPFSGKPLQENIDGQQSQFTLESLDTIDIFTEKKIPKERKNTQLAKDALANIFLPIIQDDQETFLHVDQEKTQPKDSTENPITDNVALEKADAPIENFSRKRRGSKRNIRRTEALSENTESSKDQKANQISGPPLLFGTPKKNQKGARRNKNDVIGKIETLKGQTVYSHDSAEGIVSKENEKMGTADNQFLLDHSTKTTDELMAAGNLENSLQGSTSKKKGSKNFKNCEKSSKEGSELFSRKTAVYSQNNSLLKIGGEERSALEINIFNTHSVDDVDIPLESTTIDKRGPRTSKDSDISFETNTKFPSYSEILNPEGKNVLKINDFNNESLDVFKEALEEITPKKRGPKISKNCEKLTEGRKELFKDQAVLDCDDTPSSDKLKIEKINNGKLRKDNLNSRHLDNCKKNEDSVSQKRQTRKLQSNEKVPKESTELTAQQNILDPQNEATFTGFEIENNNKVVLENKDLDTKSLDIYETPSEESQPKKQGPGKSKNSEQEHEENIELFIGPTVLPTEDKFSSEILDLENVSKVTMETSLEETTPTKRGSRKSKNNEKGFKGTLEFPTNKDVPYLQTISSEINKAENINRVLESNHFSTEGIFILENSLGESTSKKRGAKKSRNNEDGHEQNMELSTQQPVLNTENKFSPGIPKAENIQPEVKDYTSKRSGTRKSKNSAKSSEEDTEVPLYSEDTSATGILVVEDINKSTLKNNVSNTKYLDLFKNPTSKKKRGPKNCKTGEKFTEESKELFQNKTVLAPEILKIENINKAELESNDLNTRCLEESTPKKRQPKKLKNSETLFIANTESSTHQNVLNPQNDVPSEMLKIGISAKVPFKNDDFNIKSIDVFEKPLELAAKKGEPRKSKTKDKLSKESTELSIDESPSNTEDEPLSKILEVEDINNDTLENIGFDAKSTDIFEELLEESPTINGESKKSKKDENILKANAGLCTHQNDSSLQNEASSEMLEVEAIDKATLKNNLLNTKSIDFTKKPLQEFTSTKMRSRRSKNITEGFIEGAKDSSHQTILYTNEAITSFEILEIENLHKPTRGAFENQFQEPTSKKRKSRKLKNSETITESMELAALQITSCPETRTSSDLLQVESNTKATFETNNFSTESIDIFEKPLNESTPKKMGHRKFQHTEQFAENSTELSTHETDVDPKDTLLFAILGVDEAVSKDKLEKSYFNVDSINVFENPSAESEETPELSTQTFFYPQSNSLSAENFRDNPLEESVPKKRELRRSKNKGNASEKTIELYTPKTRLGKEGFNTIDDSRNSIKTGFKKMQRWAKHELQGQNKFSDPIVTNSMDSSMTVENIIEDSGFLERSLEESLYKKKLDRVFKRDIKLSKIILQGNAESEENSFDMSLHNGDNTRKSTSECSNRIEKSIEDALSKTPTKKTRRQKEINKTISSNFNISEISNITIENVSDYKTSMEKIKTDKVLLEQQSLLIVKSPEVNASHSTTTLLQIEDHFENFCEVTKRTERGFKGNNEETKDYPQNIHLPVNNASINTEEPKKNLNQLETTDDHKSSKDLDQLLNDPFLVGLRRSSRNKSLLKSVDQNTSKDVNLVLNDISSRDPNKYSNDQISMSSKKVNRVTEGGENYFVSCFGTSCNDSAKLVTEESVTELEVSHYLGSDVAVENMNQKTTENIVDTSSKDNLPELDILSLEITPDPEILEDSEDLQSNLDINRKVGKSRRSRKIIDYNEENLEKRAIEGAIVAEIKETCLLDQPKINIDIKTSIKKNRTLQKKTDMNKKSLYDDGTNELQVLVEHIATEPSKDFSESIMNINTIECEEKGEKLNVCELLHNKDVLDVECSLKKINNVNPDLETLVESDKRQNKNINYNEKTLQNYTENPTLGKDEDKVVKLYDFVKYNKNSTIYKQKGNILTHGNETISEDTVNAEHMDSHASGVADFSEIPKLIVDLELLDRKYDKLGKSLDRSKEIIEESSENLDLVESSKSHTNMFDFDEPVIDVTELKKNTKKSGMAKHLNTAVISDVELLHEVTQEVEHEVSNKQRLSAEPKARREKRSRKKVTSNKSQLILSGLDKSSTIDLDSAKNLNIFDFEESTPTTQDIIEYKKSTRRSEKHLPEVTNQLQSEISAVEVILKKYENSCFETTLRKDRRSRKNLNYNDEKLENDILGNTETLELNSKEPLNTTGKEIIAKNQKVPSNNFFLDVMGLAEEIGPLKFQSIRNAESTETPIENSSVENQNRSRKNIVYSEENLGNHIVAKKLLESGSSKNTFGVSNDHLVLGTDTAEEKSKKSKLGKTLVVSGEDLLNVNILSDSQSLQTSRASEGSRKTETPREIQKGRKPRKHKDLMEAEDITKSSLGQPETVMLDIFDFEETVLNANFEFNKGNKISKSIKLLPTKESVGADPVQFKVTAITETAELGTDHFLVSEKDRGLRKKVCNEKNEVDNIQNVKELTEPQMPSTSCDAWNLDNIQENRSNNMFRNASDLGNKQGTVNINSTQVCEKVREAESSGLADINTVESKILRQIPKVKKLKKNIMDIDVANILDSENSSENRRSPRKKRSLNGEKPKELLLEQNFDQTQLPNEPFENQFVLENQAPSCDTEANIVSENLTRKKGVTEQSVVNDSIESRQQVEDSKPYDKKVGADDTSSDTNEALPLLDRMNHFLRNLKNKNDEHSNPSTETFLQTSNSISECVPEYMNSSKDSLSVVPVGNLEQDYTDKATHNRFDALLPLRSRIMKDSILESKSGTNAVNCKTKSRKRKGKKKFNNSQKSETKNICEKETLAESSSVISLNDLVGIDDSLPKESDQKYQLAKINIKNLLLSSLKPPKSESLSRENTHLESGSSGVTTLKENINAKEHKQVYAVSQNLSTTVATGQYKFKSKKQKGKKSESVVTSQDAFQIFDKTVQKNSNLSSIGKSKNKYLLGKNLSLTALKNVLSTIAKPGRRNKHKKAAGMFSKIEPLTNIITSSEMDIAPVLDEIDKSLESEDIYDFNEVEIPEKSASGNKNKSNKINSKIRSRSCPKAEGRNSRQLLNTETSANWEQPDMPLKEPTRRNSRRSAKVKALVNIHEKAMTELNEVESKAALDRQSRRSKSLNSPKEDDIVRLCTGNEFNKSNEKYDVTSTVTVNNSFLFQEVLSDNSSNIKQYYTNLLQESEGTQIEDDTFAKAFTKEEINIVAHDPAKDDSLTVPCLEPNNTNQNISQNTNSLEVLESENQTENLTDGQELRRSRRGSRKVASYNENDLIDPLIAALENRRNRPLKKDRSVEKFLAKKGIPKDLPTEKPKLNSEELFDLLKNSSYENESLNILKPHNSFLENINEPSSNTDFNDEEFDNILEKPSLILTETEKVKDIDKIYEFTEDSPESSKEIKEFGKNKRKPPTNQQSLSCGSKISSICNNFVENNTSLSSNEIKDRDVELEKSNYCEICKKTFIRIENLIKHKTTLTHISKLSELEAKEAEERVRLENEKQSVGEPSDPLLKTTDSLKNEINITDILQQSEKTQINTKNSPSLSNNHQLNLVDIISDVLNKPVLENYHSEKHGFSEMTIPNIKKNDIRRYKSVGERKSFECESQLSRMSTPLSDSYLPSTLSKTTILEKQINLLENIIGNKLESLAASKPATENNFNDGVSSCSNNSNISVIENNSCASNRSAFNLNSETIPANLHTSFVKPTQYEEISEDSANVRVYEDSKLRKTLNRDEELFLECCSLLKSGSEVSNSNYSKNLKKPLGHFKESDELESVESKKLIQTVEEAHEYSDNSRTPTPLGDTYDDEASNSNTISSNWNLKSEKPLDKNRSFSFEEVVNKEKAGISFGEILTKGLRNQFEFMPKLDERSKETYQEIQTAIINDRRDDSDCSTASKQISTKGARKVFEGLKVSIPTEDLNLELLSNSLINKKTESKEISSNENQIATHSKPRSTRKSKPVKKSQVGSNLLFKVNKKKTSTQTNSTTSNKEQDVYNFEETQDNTVVFIKPIIKDVKVTTPDSRDKTDAIDSDNESLGYADSIGADAKSVSNMSSISAMSAKKPETTPENITKKKYKIMGKIFRNAAKAKMDEIDEELRNIPEIPEIDNLELVENYVRSCQRIKSPFLPPPLPLDDVAKKPKMTEEEMNLLFDQLLGKEVNESRPEKPISTVLLSKIRADNKIGDVKKRVNKMKNRKRSRVNSESSGDEFNINKTAKKRANKKNNQEDSGINLELELKECIGVASRKSQRKCTSGKQNVLVEYWSSDEEAFEAMLDSHKIQGKKDEEKKKKCEMHELPKKESNSEIHAIPMDRPVKTKPAKRKSQPSKKLQMASNKEPVTGAMASTASSRRKRAAANPLYHWSSSSEDESQSLIEVKPIREEDDEEDRPVQHGWIVGDSPKKLVTMLALTKGKKTDIDSVKEQGKRRTSNTVS